MMATDDKRAKELLINNGKIHSTLLDGYKITPGEVQNKTGLSFEEISRSVHSLKESDYIEVVGFGEARHYIITDKGRLYAPPPPIPDFKGQDCDPRKKKKGTRRCLTSSEKVKISGYRHFEGIVGKFPVDQNGAILIKPDILLGKIYFLLKDKKLNSNELHQTFSDHSLPSVWEACRTLCKIGLLIYEKEGKTRYYYHSDMPARSIKDEPSSDELKHSDHPDKSLNSHLADVFTTPLPLLATTSAAPITAFPSQKPIDSLEIAIDSLLTKHSLSDVMLSLVMRFDDEYKMIENLREKLGS